MPKDFKEVVDILRTEDEGKIFIANLYFGIEANLIDFDELLKSFTDYSVFESGLCCDLIPTIVKLAGQNPRTFKIHNCSDNFQEFKNGDQILNVMLWDSYYRYIADKEVLLDGHKNILDTPESRDGLVTCSFKRSANTGKDFWICSIFEANSFNLNILANTAEDWRNELGLIHYIDNKELVGMKFDITSIECYKPTVIEAQGNKRFLHNSNSDFFGVTVSLSKLETANNLGSATGLKELYCEQKMLNSFNEVEFHNIGNTITNKDSTSTDKDFLALLTQILSLDEMIEYLLQKA